MKKMIISKEISVFIALVIIFSSVIVIVSADCPDKCPPGMKSYWKAEGNADDCFGFNDGNLINGASIETTPALIQVGNGAFRFDGFDDYVQIPDHSSLNLGDGDFTLEAWINYPGGFSGSYYYPTILSKRGSINNGFIFGLYYQPGGSWAPWSLFLQIAGYNYGSCTISLDDGAWHHVAVARKGVDITFYVDGNKDGPGSVSNKNMNSNHDLFIGWDEANPDDTFWKGLIDEVAVYNRSLEDFEIECHYNNGNLYNRGYCGGIDPRFAIEPAISWLVKQQNQNGSWGDDHHIGTTGLVLIKLQERAYELGYDSPFDPNYVYSINVTKGWQYLFEKYGPNDGLRARIRELLDQDHTTGASGMIDDPDTNINDYGIFFGENQWDLTTYYSGICLSALVASGVPDHINEGGIDYDQDGDPDTFKEIAQEVVDFLAYAQGDLYDDEGGYSYQELNNAGKPYPSYNTDNSNTGYAILGLAMAEAKTAKYKAKPFVCNVPDWVKTELNVWIDKIQDPVDGDTDDGGSYYHPNGPSGVWTNLLRTGNLIFEMAFCGDSPGVTRFDATIDYIQRHWDDKNRDPGWKGDYGIDDDNDGLIDEDPYDYIDNDNDGQYDEDRGASHYQTTYCLMKGLEYNGIETIDLTNYNGPPNHDWHQEFVIYLAAQQDRTDSPAVNPNYGSWQMEYHGYSRILSTVWALFALEKSRPQSDRNSLYITKDDGLDGGPVYEGCHFTYTLTYENNKNTPVNNVVVTDTLSIHTKYDSAIPPPDNYNQGPPEKLTWIYSTLNPGQKGTIEITVKTLPGDYDWIHNEATISSNETPLITVVKDTPRTYLDPPPSPDINGNTRITEGKPANFNFVTTDPNNDDVYYYIDWGDDTYDDWFGPYPSGQTVSANHTWEKRGTYTIKVKAKNTIGIQSEWGELPISVPKIKPYIIRPFLNFLENHPNFFLLLQWLLKL